MLTSAALISLVFALALGATLQNNDGHLLKHKRTCGTFRLLSHGTNSSEVEIRAGPKRWKGVHLTHRLVLTDDAPPENESALYVDTNGDEKRPRRTRKVRSVCRMESKNQEMFVLSHAKVDCDSFQLQCAGRCKCSVKLLPSRRQKRFLYKYNISKGPKSTSRPQSRRPNQPATQLPLIAVTVGSIKVVESHAGWSLNGVDNTTTSTLPPPPPSPAEVSKPKHNTAKRIFKINLCACKKSRKGSAVV